MRNRYKFLSPASNISESFDLTTIRTKYKVIKSGYILQVLAGKYLTDLTVGAGWLGQVKGAGFKGEASYFQPYSASNLNIAIMEFLKICAV